MEDKRLRRLVLSALFASLICLATFVIKIPLPAAGYVHLGDGFVILSGWILGPLYGSLSAGVGSMLADVLAGYPVYAPATLVIKALAAFFAAAVWKWADGKKIHTIAAYALSGFSGGIAVPAGYFVFEWFVYSPGIAAADVIGNSLQAVVGIACAAAVYSSLDKSGVIKHI